MNIKSLVEFHYQAPANATHVLRLGDRYEYANFTGFNYDSCDNSSKDELTIGPELANSDWFFRVGDGDWVVYLKLNQYR